MGTRRSSELPASRPAIRPLASRHSVPRWAEVLLVAMFAGAVFVVHDVAYLLDHPYWLDESWVAVSTRAPLSELPRVTAVTPLGWTLLLRAVSVAGEQSLRLLPLAFSAATVIVAYLLGRELRVLGPVGNGALTAGATLLVPAMLERNDLKQYTADAFVAVLLVLLVARLETAWRASRLAAVGAIAAGGMLISHAAAFAGAAALLGVVLAAAAARSTRQLRQSLLVGAAAAAGMAAVYVAVDRRHVNPSLVAYWRDAYVPNDQGVAGAAAFGQERARDLLPYLGVDAPELALFTVGAVVTLLVARRVATALTVPLMFVLVATGSTLHRYPFLDLRTSTFLLVAAAVLVAIGVAGVARLLARVHVLVGLVVIGVVATSFVRAAWPHMRTHNLTNEDVRSQVRYVATHRRPGDVVLVTMPAIYGFAYYSRGLPLEFPATSRVATGFTVRLPRAANMILVGGREPSDVASGIRRAAALACRAPNPRIWIIRTRIKASEARAFADHLRGTPVEILRVGPDPLLRQTPSCPSTALA